MRFAYADPPYLGLASFYKNAHPDWADYDRIETHQALIERLCLEYPDGWAMSLHSPALRAILPCCPQNCRVLAWVKPFASFKPGVGLAYAWEPVIFRGGRRRTKDQNTIRDWLAESITLQRGLTGAKPAAFMHWVLDALNVQPGDAVDDLYPGSGACSAVIAQRLHEPVDCDVGLFERAERAE